MTKETISDYVVRNMLIGILDDVKFLIKIDDANKPILMDESALKRFKDARSCLHDIAFQQKAKYTDLAITDS
jgi:hypothetical protein